MDDIFISTPLTTNPTLILDYINSIHPNIKFTMELSNNHTLPFLDTLLSWNNSPTLLFSVYRKPTSNPSYIHWYSTHSQHIKSGVLSSLFLRALRICSPTLLHNEIKYIFSTFKKLSYPTYIIKGSLKKAKNNFYNPTTVTNTQSLTYLPIPHLPHKQILKTLPSSLRLTSSNTSSLKRIFKPPTHLQNNISQCIYKIPCHQCPSHYIGETNNFIRRLGQHKHDLTSDSQNSALTSHRSSLNHNINIKDTCPILEVLDPTKRKLLESLCIQNLSNFNLQKGEYTFNPTLNNILTTTPFFKNIKAKFT